MTARIADLRSHAQARAAIKEIIEMPDPQIEIRGRGSARFCNGARELKKRLHTGSSGRWSHRAGRVRQAFGTCLPVPPAPIDEPVRNPTLPPHHPGRRIVPESGVLGLRPGKTHRDRRRSLMSVENVGVNGSQWESMGVKRNRCATHQHRSTTTTSITTTAQATGGFNLIFLHSENEGTDPSPASS